METTQINNAYLIDLGGNVFVKTKRVKKTPFGEEKGDSVKHMKLLQKWMGMSITKEDQKVIQRG